MNQCPRGPETNNKEEFCVCLGAAIGLLELCYEMILGLSAAWSHPTEGQKEEFPQLQDSKSKKKQDMHLLVL